MLSMIEADSIKFRSKVKACGWGYSWGVPVLQHVLVLEQEQRSRCATVSRRKKRPREFHEWQFTRANTKHVRNDGQVLKSALNFHELQGKSWHPDPGSVYRDKKMGFYLEYSLEQYTLLTTHFPLGSITKTISRLIVNSLPFLKVTYNLKSCVSKAIEWIFLNFILFLQLQKYT